MYAWRKFTVKPNLRELVKSQITFRELGKQVRTYLFQPYGTYAAHTFMHRKLTAESFPSQDFPSGCGVW